MSGSGNEVLRKFMRIRKNSYKYAPVFQRLHGFINGGDGKQSLKSLREEGKRVGVKVVLGEKSDLNLCQLADSMVNRTYGSTSGVSVVPSKSQGVYYGHLASHRNRFAVPSELKYSESTYSSRDIHICLFTDLQQECPDIYTQIFAGNVGNTNVYSFGHVYNNRNGLKNVGGETEFSAWLDGRANLFNKLPTKMSNIYVYFSDNFLEMYPTNYPKIFDRIKSMLPSDAFVRFSYASRHPISYNALHAYPFPSIGKKFSEEHPFSQYNVNVLSNVQRQEHAENLSDSKFTMRMLAHSSLFRSDQPANELLIAQKTPAEDNSDFAFIDKFQDYKTSNDPIFISEFSDKLQLMHPHLLLTYMFGLMSFPSVLSANILPLCVNMKLSASQRTSVFKNAHTSLLENLMLDFDNDANRTSISRSVAFGRTEFIEDLRAQLWQYTVIPGTSFNKVKAKALLQYIQEDPAATPDGPYYEFDEESSELSSSQLAKLAVSTGSGKVNAPSRTARATDSIWTVDCEFVRHSIPLRGHIHEVNQKTRMSWCKLAPELSA